MNHREICKWYDVCPLKRFYQEGRLHRRWIEDYCKGHYLDCTRYKMEEQGVYHSDNMMPDGRLDESLK